jgi:internalin A
VRKEIYSTKQFIPPGTDWARTIDTHLETASVILLLVSADFLASDYCHGVEMKRALERREIGEARVVPVLVHPVENWDSTQLWQSPSLWEMYG